MRAETFIVHIILEQEKKGKRGTLGLKEEGEINIVVELVLLKNQVREEITLLWVYIVWRVDRGRQPLLGFSCISPLLTCSCVIDENCINYVSNCCDSWFDMCVMKLIYGVKFMIMMCLNVGTWIGMTYEVKGWEDEVNDMFFFWKIGWWQSIDPRCESIDHVKI